MKASPSERSHGDHANGVPRPGQPPNAADFTGPSVPELRHAFGGDEERADLAALIISHSSSDTRVLASLLVELINLIRAAQLDDRQRGRR